MANRRMMSKDVQGTDRFYDNSVQARNLYCQLCLFADDDGFSDNYKSVMRTNSSDRAALDELIEHGYILPFEKDGVVVIAHWKLMNTVPPDRYHPTKYIAIKDTLEYNADGTYKIPKTIEASRMDTSCIHPVSKMETQNRKDERREKEDSGKTPTTPPTTVYSLFGKHNNVRLTNAEYADIQTRVKNYQERINKFSDGIKAGWKCYDPNGTDHHDKIILYAEQDGYIHASTTSSSHKPSLSDRDYKQLIKYGKDNGMDADTIDSIVFPKANLTDAATTDGIVKELKDLIAKASNKDRV